MKFFRFFAVLTWLCPLLAQAKLEIATTTQDLEALVRTVGGDQVQVFSIGKGTQDPHQIEAKPSFMVKLRSADLVIAQGLELETAWIDPLVQGSRNPKLNRKGGIFEIAPELDPIEIPKGAVSRAEGDVHPGGNPHFQLDPLRLGQAAVLIANRLGEMDAEHKALFASNAQAFQKKMQDKTKDWQERIKKTGVREIATYHKTFSYFCDRFGLTCNLQLEPKPGIPPTAGHLLAVIDEMKKRKIRFVLIENLYDDSVAPKLKQSLPDLRVERVPVSVGGAPGIESGQELIEQLVRVLEGTTR